VDQLPDRTLGQAHGIGHLGPTQPLEGHLDDRVVLARWKLSHSSQGIHGQHPPLRHLLGGLGDRMLLLKLGQGRGRRIFAPGLVAEDLMQPAAEVPHLGAGLQSRERGQEGLLDEVLSAMRIDATGIGGQRLAVTLDDQLECALVPQMGESDQSLVRL
jgi:hypothetical protein